MEFIQRKLAQLKSAWGQLSVSGRVALTLAVALVVALLVIVTRYAGEPDKVPLPSSFQGEELVRAVAALRSHDIDAEARGGQIYVASGERNLALGMLAYSDAMPQSGISFEQLFDGGGIFEPEADKERKARYLVKRELEDCMRRIPGVRRATVNINYGSQHTIRTTPEGVSAAVSVETSGGIDKRLARSMASLVAHSVHGLKLENVTVTDLTSGQAFDFSADSALYNTDYVNTVKTYRSYFEGELMKQFADIRGLRVGVHVVPNLDRVREQKHEVDNTKVIDGSVQTTESTSTGGASAGSVGVVPNAGEGVAGGSATAGALSDTQEHIGSPIDYGVTNRTTEITPGEVKDISAAISVPRSYLEKIARIDAPTPAGEEPKPVDASTIENVFAKEKARIAKQAAKVIGTKTPEAVDVDWHYDVEPAGAAVAMAEGPGLVGYLQQYGPTAGLGLFAAMALLMVYSVVRKFQPAEVPSDAPAPETAGEAGLTLDSILEGVELEADTIRASKMQEQISNMIKEDPDTVAGLIKRWVVQE